MKRMVWNKLLKWKEQAANTPLLLTGARRTGKSWILNKFGDKEFTNKIYISFNDDLGIKTFFRSVSGENNVIKGLSEKYNCRIDENTLIILDEIEMVPDIYPKICTWTKNNSSLRVAMSGSIMDVNGLTSMNDSAKTTEESDNVKTIRMFPMNFREFTEAVGSTHLLYENFENMNERTKSSLFQELKKYMLVGGMPQCVSMFLEGRSFDEIRDVQNTIIWIYTSDFARYTENNIAMALKGILEDVGIQTIRDITNKKNNINTRFSFKSVSAQSYTKTYDNPFDWLKDNGLIYLIRCLDSPDQKHLCSSAENDRKQIRFIDTGLLGAMLNSGEYIFNVYDKSCAKLNRTLAESFIVQELISLDIDPETLFYYNNCHDDQYLSIDKNCYTDPFNIKLSRIDSQKSLLNFVLKESVNQI